MKYITDTLGIDACADQWGGAGRLPYYLIDRYEFKRVALDNVPCLFMKPKGELDTLNAIKKHIRKVHEEEPLPVVLELNGVTAWRRKSLIAARIPFAAPECQLYLPFLGIALNERYTSEAPFGETLMPSSQLLLFYYLYQDKQELHTGGTAEMFGFSAMQISRAIKQLVMLGLVSVRKEGVRIIISSEENHRELFERAMPFIMNPVRKKKYIWYGNLPVGLPLSGYSALSELTMLGSPTKETFAYFGKVGDLIGIDELIDSGKQAEVEIWRYCPTVLSSRPGIADTLSIIASIHPFEDERVEQSVEGLFSELWG